MQRVSSAMRRSLIFPVMCIRAEKRYWCLPVHSPMRRGITQKAGTCEIRRTLAISHLAQKARMIFVKLGQMLSKERAHVRVDTRCSSSWQTIGNRESCSLFESTTERVSLQRLPSAERILYESEGGVEILVLAGAAKMQEQLYPRGAWLRLPVGSDEALYAGPDGLTCYIKSGHLAHVGASSEC